VSVLAAYGRLEALGDVVTTGEAAAALRTSSASASRTLATLEAEGRALRLRSGLWHIGRGRPLPTAIVRDICRPHPAYVSFLSALDIAGAIDQRPRVISVASLDRARTIETAVGTYAVQHLPPSLFGGWEETGNGPVAAPVKAIFDLCYVSAAHRGRLRSLPELDLPELHSLDQFQPWLSRIGSPRVRSVTEAGLRGAIVRSHAR
jgi:predicted transcriptional regulator of viral defense system